MPKIEVTQQGSKFVVTVSGGGTETRHEVTVPDGFYQKLTQGKQSKEACLKASFRFLLEREPKEAVLSRFDLPLISRYFPEFEREYSRYVS